jgi:hypothetical protein
MSKRFVEAAASYLEHGGSPKYLTPVLEYFGETPLAEIYPFDIRKMAEALYPEHSASSKNRMAVTPARAVILHAYQRGWCAYVRVSRFKEEKQPHRKSPASQVWLATFVRQCEKDRLPHIAVGDHHRNILATARLPVETG